MHAQRTGWQRLATIATAVSSLLLSVAVAAADSAPRPRQRAPISPVPDVADAAGARLPAVAPPISGVRSTRSDTLDDVAAIRVPVVDPRVTVAYTVEGGPGETADIVTTQVDGVEAADALLDELQGRPRVVAAEIDTVFAALAVTTEAREGEGERQRAGGRGQQGEGERQRAGGRGQQGASAVRGSVRAAAMADRGQTVGSDPERDRQWGLDLLEAERVWSRGTACGQTIAVIDSGVDGEHPDLRGIVRRGKNMVSRGSGAVDRSGHGTEVAGVAAAAHDNGRGISGMAPGARVLPVGIEDAAGQMHASDLAAAIRYAITHEADVINLSLGGPERSPNVDYWLDRAHEAGIPVVASAGNAYANGNPPIWPAASPTTIAVGAVAPTGVWAPFSSAGSHVDLVAPGVAVLTTARGDAYTAGNGTSLSAPFVSATIAMLRAADPDLGPDEVRDLLVDHATDAGPPGRDDRFGHGVVNPLASLRAVDAPLVRCFTDVADLTLADEIQRLGLAGVTDGCAARRFCPAQQVTRGQMATFLSRVVAQPATDADFFDDDATSPHEEAINRLAVDGIAQGCTTARAAGGWSRSAARFFEPGSAGPGSANYCPNANVTRAQMAAFIARALDLAASGIDAFDDDDRSPHESAINALAATGITGGCDAAHPQRFCPDAPVTRAQMAAFLVRMMDHGP